MDKKYNGFNNGRDKSDGVGGREVNHGTQETMTKEQTAIEILVEHIRVMNLTGFPADWELVNNAIDQSKRELSAERERAGKLVGALNEYIVLLGEELDEIVFYANSHGWKSKRFEKGEELRQKIKQTLNEYEATAK